VGDLHVAQIKRRLQNTTYPYVDVYGVTRIVERRGPADEHDQHGKQAEDALIEALSQRLQAGGSEVTLDTKTITLVERHIDRLEEDGRAVRTIDT
jgi:hypothetical protein